MDKKNKIMLVFIGISLVITLLSSNMELKIISLMALLIMGINFYLSNHIRTKKILEELKCTNKPFIKLRSNYSSFVFLIYIYISCLYYNFGYISDTYICLNHDKEIINLIDFISRLDIYDKMFLVVLILFSVLMILSALISLFPDVILTNDKIIFFSGLSFKIDEIHSVEIKDSFLPMSRSKVMKIDKDIYLKSVIVPYEKLEDVKRILAQKIEI